MSALALALVAALAAPKHSDYTVERIDGWEVKVETVLLTEAPELWAAARRELGSQLFQITRAVPDPPLTRLREVTVWVHRKSPWTKCMAYHPSAEWLRDNGLNPDMAKGIEIGDPATFLAWTRQQPWMVLHELAHAYHDRVLEGGFENTPVAAAFEAAKQGGRYESVLRYSGRTERHYALTNPMEYFAEATEAYFGVNDFFPFVRAELRDHDPGADALMVEVWGEPKNG